MGPMNLLSASSMAVSSSGGSSRAPGASCERMVWDIGWLTEVRGMGWLADERGMGWLAPERGIGWLGDGRVAGMGWLLELGPSAPNWLGVVRLEGARPLVPGRLGGWLLGWPWLVLPAMKASRALGSGIERARDSRKAWIVDAKLVLNDDLMKRGAATRAARLAAEQQTSD